MKNNKTKLSEIPRVAPEGTKGIGLMLGSAASISGANGTVQYLSQGIHVFEIAFFRQLFGLILMATIFLRSGFRPLFTKKIWLHLIRSILNVLSMLAFFYGLSLEPLAKVISLALTAPLFATLGAVIFLKERMTPARWAAIFIGAVGALIILRPGIQTVSLGALMVLVSNMLWAVTLVVIKVLTRTDTSVTVALYSSLLQAPMAFIFAFFVWQWPSLDQLAWLILLAILGTISQLALAEAFHHADATLVLPADFTKVIWGSLIGYLCFNQIPEIWVGVGAVVICLAVFYNAYFEAQNSSSGSSTP